MLKLIVWDLDDTLWSGTLAEGDEVELFQNRVEAIKKLNEQGVVHSICSKNDPEKTRRKLEELGLYEQFVFPSISFEPKGFRIKQIISDMNLRAPDVVFVDDNQMNLKEVEFSCPEIQTFDATTSEFDDFLQQAIIETSGGKSRVERYRILERKHADRLAVGGSNEEFLRSSNIKVCFIRMADNLPYARRIEELINRTNQLNFLKSRVQPGSMADALIASNSFEVATFVWDNYGNYGLVGFGSILLNHGLNHFTFSCRTMNMGIENATAWALKTFKASRGLKLPVEPYVPDWIEVVDPSSPEAIEKISASSDESPTDSSIRVMANCQSAAIAHYMNLPVPVDFDNWPRTFTLSEFFLNGDFKGRWRNILVYAAFVDYLASYWPNNESPSLDVYRDAVESFVGSANEHGSQLIVLLPVENFSVEDEPEGRTMSAFHEKNIIWRKISTSNPNVHIIELSEIDGAVGAGDPRHLTRPQLMDLSSLVKNAIQGLTK